MIDYNFSFDLTAIMKMAPELQDVKKTCDKFSSMQSDIIQNITSVCNNSSEDTYLDLIQNYGVIKTEVNDKKGSGK